MTAATFRAVFLGIPMNDKLFLLVAGTTADNGWAFIFKVEADAVTPWPNPQEVHGGINKAVAEITLFKPGGNTVYAWDNMQVNVWRNVSGMPLRVYAESFDGDQRGNIEFDTGYAGQPPGDTGHRWENGEYVGDLAFIAQPGAIPEA